MKFRRLRLAGFKSFVDPTELRIEDGLTGVVGPNGCGKSNLLEAIRWVMGENSPRSMRGGGMEDVIFAGTSLRPARDVADVTLLLDNSSRRAPAAFNDSDEIEVTRRIERGLGSAYRINGRDVRQKDVQLLFADAATGAHSPALVSQGRIGAIISAKPQERRLMLEEAAGIAGLHVRRKEAEQRLRAAEANLARLDDVMKAMESQIAALKRQARQAERYRLLSDRIRSAEAQLLFAKWREAQAAAEAARGAAQRAEAEVADATRAMAAVSARQADAAAALPLLRDGEAAAAAVLQRLNQARDRLADELQSVEARQRELAAQAQAVARDIAREAELADDAGAALSALAAEAEAVAARLADAGDRLPPLAERVAASEQKASHDERVLAARIEAQAAAQAQRRAAEAALVGATGRRDRVRVEIERLAREAAQIEAEDDATAAAEAAATDLQREVEVIAAATARIEAAEVWRAAADTEREAAQQARAEAQAVLAALEAEARSLERSLAQPAGQGGAGVIDHVFVHAGFESALAAALGEDLSAPVGLESAPRAWLGAEAADDPALPPGLTPLADHIAAPPELARRLGQVGVAESIAAARAALPRLRPGQRIVTREGALLRWDGFVATGGNAVAAAERLMQRNRLVEVERLLEGARADLARAEAALAAARSEGEAAHAEEKSARSERSRAERARDEAAQRAARAAAMIERRRTRLDAVTSARERAEHDRRNVEQEYDETVAALQAVPDVELLARETETARAAVEGSRAALAQARAEHATLARSIDVDRARSSAIGSERAGWEKRSAGSAAQLLELEARARAIAAEQAALSGKPDVIAQQQGALAGELAAATSARADAADRLAHGESRLKAADAELRQAGEALAQAREARAGVLASVEHQDSRREEMARIIGERFQCPPPLLPAQAGFAEEAIGAPQPLSAELERLQAERERLGPVNLRAETELAELEGQHLGSQSERIELETAIARLRGSIGALNREGRARLLEAFEKVDAHFRELFTGLFAGGQAHLALVESDDPLEAGLEIYAQPPGKKLQTMTLLSGGEQALTACALIFALFLTNPAPICVLDEVDAPLDDANVERFCDLLDRMVSLTDTRFLIVTHNAVTMSRLHRLFGVTMAERGISQLVSVDLQRAELMLAAE